MSNLSPVVLSSKGEVLVRWLADESSYVGPHGAYPTQGCGLIEHLGQRQHIYFHYRAGKASLVISGNETPAYSENDLNTVEYCCARREGEPEMPRDEVDRMVRRWVQSYLTSKEPTVKRVIGRRLVEVPLSELRDGR